MHTISKIRHCNTSKYTLFIFILIILARANTTYEGIDYTFRRKFDSFINKENKEGEENKEEVNRLKHRKKEIQIQEHIFDLEKTILLNQDCINKIIPTLDLKENEKKKLLDSISKIYKYFNNKKENRQKIRNINSKILMNKQIIEEIKRRKDEISFFHKDQINNMEASVTKKGGAVKMFQKKFTEVEIFIQRESKTPENIQKYGKWKNFTLIPFMKKNEDLLKRKCFYEQEIKKIKEKIDICEKEYNNLKEEKSKLKNNKNIIINPGNKIKRIEKYYKNDLKKYENDIEFLKIKINLLSDINIKKSAIPSFKSKNPISNLDVNLNLLEPGIVELELNLKKLMENEEIKLDEKEQIKQMNIELNKINEKFEKEIGNEIDNNALKGKELKPPENDNWGSFNDSGDISDIEKDN